MECLLVVLQLSAQVSHPIDVELPGADIECLGVEALAERLVFNEAVEDAVHWDLGFEFLIRHSGAFNEVLAQRRLAIPVPCRLLNSSLILKGAARRTISQIAVEVILQEESLFVGAFRALERHRGSLLSFTVEVGLLVRLGGVLLCDLLLLLIGEREVYQFLFSGLFGRRCEAQ